jgi:hypothetical protein
MRSASMAKNEITFFRPTALKIAPGIHFYGTVEIGLNPDDVSGWWVKSVMAFDRGCNRELGEPLARMVRVALDKDTAACDEVTGQCVRMMARIKERGEA